MKLTQAPSLVTGIHLGELAINLMPSNQKEGAPPILAKFALVREDGSFCGSFTRVGEFSEKTLVALRTFIECLEDDALGVLFRIESAEEKPAETPPPDEPPQF